MKQKTILSIVLFNLFIFTAFAQQNLKVGYADVEYILSKMPETAKVEEDLKAIMTKLTSKRDSIVADYNVKFEDYQKNATTFTDNIKKEKETNLLQIQRTIQQFDSDVQVGFNARKAEMLQPIYNRIAELVQVVAKENNYTHVFNTIINNTSVLLYAEDSSNISELVITKARQK